MPLATTVDQVRAAASSAGWYWVMDPADARDADWIVVGLAPDDPSLPRAEWGAAWQFGSEVFLTDDEMVGRHIEGPITPPRRPIA